MNPSDASSLKAGSCGSIEVSYFDLFSASLNLRRVENLTDSPPTKKFKRFFVFSFFSKVAKTDPVSSSLSLLLLEITKILELGRATIFLSFELNVVSGFGLCSLSLLDQV